MGEVVMYSSVSVDGFIALMQAGAWAPVFVAAVAVPASVPVNPNGVYSIPIPV